MPKKGIAVWTVAALLALNAVLLAEGAGMALPGSLGGYFFGPKLVRAEVLIKDNGVVHDYRIDRGVVRAKSDGALGVLERDGSLVTIQVAPGASITIGGRPATFGALRRGMVVTVIRDGDAPANEVRATPQVTAAGAAELHPTGSPGPQLLLVEDEESIGSLVSAYLEQSGYRVAWVRSGEEALLTLGQLEPRMVILDIGLPGADGFDVCRDIRARSAVPILMLTARDEEADRVAGLEVGADDYVSKPFSPRELAARVKALLRRTEPAAPLSQRIEVGDVALDPQAREVTVSGEPVELTGKEFDLLAYLLENAGIVVSRDQLLDRVWGMSYAGGTRTVDVHVAQLRRKLGRPDSIRTFRGSGYKAIKP